MQRSQHCQKIMVLSPLDRRTRTVLFFIYLSILSIWCTGVQAGEPSSRPSHAFSQAVVALQSATNEKMIITRSASTSFVSFLRTPAAIPVAMGKAEVRARSFLSMYGDAFVADKGTLELAPVRVQENDKVGMSHARFQQLFNGIPVTMGEISVHLNAAGVVAVNAKLLPALNGVNTTPTFLGDAALAVIQDFISKHRSYIIGKAKFSQPRLEIFNRSLLNQHTETGVTRLAWFIEATGPALREYIWVDAHTGTLLLHFSQLTDAKNRLTYDAQSTSTQRLVLMRTEGQPDIGDFDVDTAHNYIGDSYDYYLIQHGRDSYDNLGSDLISTVRFCPAGQPCPYQNAFWNGVEMTYGAGFSAADDVVAHELTHGVTEFSANLIYYGESGALNESYSDIFGEAIDLGNIGGNDAPSVRWQIGEDLPGIGAIRNMMDPTLFANPGKVSDPEYFCGTADNAGVHTNSGVPNHAFALMTDGGTYNGSTITGIGLPKAGKIQYRALTVYLTASSTLLDNYNALNQSCTDLIGTSGIIQADCDQVLNAANAVEMNTPTCVGPPQMAYCPAGQVPSFIFQDNLENTASGNWVNNLATGTNHWNTGVGVPPIYWTDNPKSGIYSFKGQDHPVIGDSTVEMASSVALPAGAHMQYEGDYSFETTFDGGVIEYSTNGGVTWTDAGNLISAGQGYTHLLSTAWGNPLGGRLAFSGDSAGYRSTQLNLNPLAGLNARFRFRVGTDSSVSAPGWFVDDIAIYTCALNPDDIIVFRSGAWLFHDFTTGAQTSSAWTGALPGDIPVYMDYDGDGVKDYTVFSNGAWHFYNADGSYNKGIWTGGLPGDVPVPVPADYDGDGTDDVVVFSNGAWLFYNFARGTFDHGVWTSSPLHWTGGTSVPIPMDYDGDGAADMTVYSGGPWHFYNADGSYNKGVWTGGVPGDMPVPADYDGNGTDDIVVFRAGAWLTSDFTTGAQVGAVWTGLPAHWTGGISLPAPLDYDGDGAVDMTVYSGGPWHFFNADGSYNKGVWTDGVAGDLPISRRLLP